jgi:prepilin-type N-terminal cleavage/methylation domain-containing protein
MFYKAMQKKKNGKKAFTLIELIVVIAIIGVLVAILVPTMNNFVTQAKQATAKANARTVFSVAQAECTFEATTATPVADGTYSSGGTGTYIDKVESQVGDLATGGSFSIVVSGGAVTQVNYTMSGNIYGGYPATYTGPTTP